MRVWGGGSKQPVLQLPISLIQVSLGRAQMFGGSFETSSQKSKTVQRQTEGWGGGGSAFTGVVQPNKNPHEEHEQFIFKCGHELKGRSIELAGKILVNHELVFMCSLGNLRNEQ